MRREKPDIVHINTVTTYVAAKAAIRRKVPLVWHVREMLEEDLDGQFWNEREAISMLTKAKKVIAISDCVKEKYFAMLPDNKVVRIYNGIDVATYYCQSHKILQTDSVVITMAGRITANKGQYQCLYELKELLECDSNVVLRFAGTGDKSEIRKMLQLINNSKIKSWQIDFMGYVTDMKTVWETTDIAVVFSRFEAFGRVTVEAMVAGALVLGFNSGGTAELIQNGVTGFLFESSGEHSLKKTIQNVLKNRDQVREVALTGQSQAKECYTAEQNARLVAELYQSILRENTSDCK